MRKLGSNIWYSFLNFLVISLFGSVFWIILYSIFNVEEYGIISFIYSSSILLVNILSFGSFNAIWKYCSEKKLKNILFFSLLFSIFNIFLIFLFSILYFKNILIFYFSFVLFFSSYLENVLYGFQEFKKIFISNLLSSVFKLILILYFYYFFGIKIETAVLVTIISILIGVLTKFLFSKDYIFKNFKVFTNFFEVKKYLSLSLSSFLFNFSSFFYSNFLVVSSFFIFSSLITGIIYFSQLLYSIISFIPSIIISASLPIISELSTNDKSKKINFIIENLFIISIVTIIPITFLIAFHLESVLKILNLRKESLISFSPLFLIISLISTFFLLSNIFFSFLFSTNKIREIVSIEIFSLAIFLIFLLISSSINLLIFLLSYLFLSFLRFFLYYLKTFNTLKLKLDLKLSIKLCGLIIFSFFISKEFASNNYFLDILFLLFSIFLISVFIKILRIFTSNTKNFIKKLNLPSFVKKIILIFL